MEKRCWFIPKKSNKSAMQKVARKLLVEGNLSSLTPKLLGALSQSEYNLYLTLYRDKNIEKDNFAADF